MTVWVFFQLLLEIKEFGTDAELALPAIGNTVARFGSIGEAEAAMKLWRG
jgi:hypothetical protein